MKEQKKSLDVLRKLFDVMEDINHIKDIDALLDRILLETRRFTNADAGSIYLVEKGRLKFSYTQSDTLLKEGNAKYLYINQELPISDTSIAGYVALSKKLLMIKDAYRIPSNYPYYFDSSFDRQTAYRTKSVLAVPLKTSRDVLIGVLEILNKQGTKNTIIPFNNEDALYVMYFAHGVAVTIEKTLLIREMIFRMIRMAEEHDPRETKAHVNRVASYCIEIYQKWARNAGLDEDTIKICKDNLRIAAMLHDVGKIGITDKILKKPAKLDEKERRIMEMHTILGAKFFEHTTTELDALAAEICMNHHEKWDGTGYPGKIYDVSEGCIHTYEGKKYEEIPIIARIVALADVYDALRSKRVYKNAWNEKKVLQYIKDQKGKQFDPAIVDTFFSIYDVINTIQKKYEDEKTFG